MIRDQIVELRRVRAETDPGGPDGDHGDVQLEPPDRFAKTFSGRSQRHAVPIGAVGRELASLCLIGCDL